MGNRDDIQKAGDVLKDLFNHLNFKEGQAYVSFFSDWLDLVGVDLACHVRPIDIRRKALVLEVDHPGWMQMFQLKQKRILHRIQKKHPSLEITAVHFRLKGTAAEEPHMDPDQVDRGYAPPGSSVTQVPSEQTPRVQRSSAQPAFIKNHRLRKALENLGKEIKKRSKH